MVDTNKASQRWILLVAFSALDITSRPRVFSVGTVEDGLFDYDLGFGEQQLIPNSQVITSSSQTPRDFPKQTLLNTTPPVRPSACPSIRPSAPLLPHFICGPLRINCWQWKSSRSKRFEDYSVKTLTTMA